MLLNSILTPIPLYQSHITVLNLAPTVLLLTPLSESSGGILHTRSMSIVTTTRYGAVRVTLPYSVPSDGMPCVRVRVQSTSPAYSEYPRHRVNPCKEGHAPSDKPPKAASCATYPLLAEECHLKFRSFFEAASHPTSVPFRYGWS